MSTYNDVTITAIKEKFSSIIETSDIMKEVKTLYFAGPWFSKKGDVFYNQVQRVIEEFHSVIRCCIYFPRENSKNSGTPKQCFDMNMFAIDECDVVLAWVDEKDTGTAFEIGYAKAKGKKVYLLGYDLTTFQGSKTNLMLAYGADGIILLEDLVKFLIGQNVSKSVEFTWGDVE